MDPLTEMNGLLSAINRNELTPERARRLEQLVVENRAACQRYLSYMQLCASLEWEFAAGLVAEDIRVCPSEEETSPTAIANPPAESAPTGVSVIFDFLADGVRQAGQILTSTMGLSILCAVLSLTCVLLGLALVTTGHQQGDVADKDLPTSMKTPMAVAQLTRVLDVRWSQRAAAKMEGAYLVPTDRFNLPAGTHEGY